MLESVKKCMTLGAKICIRSLKKVYIGPLKWQYGSNCNAPWSEFARNIGKIQQQVIYVFIKVDQTFLKGQYISTCIVSDSNFSKNMFETEITENLLMEMNKESLRGQYLSDCNIFLKLMKMLCKNNMDQTLLSFIIFCRIPVIENRVNSEI